VAKRENSVDQIYEGPWPRLDGGGPYDPYDRGYAPRNVAVDLLGQHIGALDLASPEGRAEMQRYSLEVYFAGLEHERALEPGPLYAWEALVVARAWGVLAPDWALDDLAGRGRELLRVVDTRAERRRLGTRILAALGFGGKGQGSVFTRHANAGKRVLAAQLVAHWRDRGETVEAAIEKVAAQFALPHLPDPDGKLYRWVADAYEPHRNLVQH